jgi:hypothetical protein
MTSTIDRFVNYKDLSIVVTAATAQGFNITDDAKHKRDRVRFFIMMMGMPETGSSYFELTIVR